MNRLRSDKGFTLIEIIMTIIIVGIISIVVGPILIQGFNSFFASTGVTDMDAQGKLAIERMAREIRLINPATITSPVSPSSQTSLAFSSDGINGISYQLSGNQLFRNTTMTFWVFVIPTGQNLLATNVTALNFNYLDQNWNPLPAGSAASAVWGVQIRFTLNYAGGGFNATKTFQTSVFLRNAV